MDYHICDFTALVSKDIQKQLDTEFQYQMNLTDGEWVFWEDKYFQGHQVEPAIDATGQAILQFFTTCACPISMLRLGRSMSSRNSDHGPITSDSMAVKYLLTGMEFIANNLYDQKKAVGMRYYMDTLEFRFACELLLSYKNEMRSENICPEIIDLIMGVVKKTSHHTLQ
ncbi:hypothetical protein [Neptunicella sp.]|uniref:hypothetical protein n=1 Tax=Neptunicella sp. TaxID=2125986 RepID=UPI003F691936